MLLHVLINVMKDFHIFYHVWGPNFEKNSTYLVAHKSGLRLGSVINF